MKKIIAVRLTLCSFLFGGDLLSMKVQILGKLTLPAPRTEETLEAEIPSSEYPRPQVVRPEWLNLNGVWDYMGGKDLFDPVTATTPPAFPAKIEKVHAPYPLESELSGITCGGDTCLWYEHGFSVLQAWKGRHVLLDFGAVDRISSVFVNGKKVGIHIGGYDALSLNITDYLKSGENILVVGAYDPNDGRAASGKNGSCGDYISTSGIWQTVWLELVEKQYISQIKFAPDLKSNRLEVIAHTEGKELKVTAIVDNGTSEVTRTKGSSNVSFCPPIWKPRLWNPDDPFLHGLKLQLRDQKGKIIDEVSSYFGMRSTSTGKVDGVLRSLLNGESVFHIGLLDRGYWPDGASTAPTDKALLYDMGLAERVGLNVIRRHIKVEPQCWYYHHDRLGLMVWQDMSNLWEPDGKDSVAVRKRFHDELRVMIDQHVNSPSIVMWVPFDKNWGASEATGIIALVKKYDPNRWVNGMSGYNCVPDYRKAYGDPGNRDSVDMCHYGKIKSKAIPRPDDKRAASLSKLGGRGLFVCGHMWPVRNDAYEMMLNREALTDTYTLMPTELEQMINCFKLSAAIYMQTTDVEHEINGLIIYDRKVEKMDLEKAKYINQKVIRCTRKR